MPASLPAGFTPRLLEVLKLVACLAPAPFRDLERLARVAIPGLAALRSAHRLLYRELERLERSGHVTTKRLPLAPAGVYVVTEKGGALLRVLGLADVPEDALARLLAFPEHERLLRTVRLELLLARFAGDARVARLVWDDRARFPVTVEGRAQAYEPDGLYRVTDRAGRSCTVYVELDRGSKNLTVWRQKIKKAGDPLRIAGSPARLLVLALGARRLEALVAAAQEALPRDGTDVRGVLLAPGLDAERLLEAIAPAGGGQ